ncbi:Pr6Pr family membrane protein [Microbacterium sp. LWH13-1.2]|uniref:Pr6Pr family membrane protein n=1 Tax=Microbacterium sp. LWH13-1.2 TaxID=3135260 RepID=UPI003139952D
MIPPVVSSRAATHRWFAARGETDWPRSWASEALHTIFPILLVLDWIFVDDRSPLPWRRLWAVLPYPVLWLGVVLVRGATDGWVPYGFLLPERGAVSLATHAAGLLLALLVSGALVWALSRTRARRRVPAVRRSPTRIGA